MSDAFAFVRNDTVSEPGIVGATWWNKSLSSASSLRTRRTLINVLAAGGLLALVGIGIGTCAGDDDRPSGPPLAEELKPSLEMQREYGWSFGAEGGELTFEGSTAESFNIKLALSAVASEMEPKNLKLAPYHQLTLLSAPNAPLKKTLPDHPPGKALLDVMMSIHTSAATEMYHLGAQVAVKLRKEAEALAAPSSQPGRAPPTTASPQLKPGASATPDAEPRILDALVVDLPGALSVAFAAGAADIFEPVLLFDNWPHPKGVVASHRPLGALIHFRASFSEARAKRGRNAPPLFVLGSERLTPYTSDTTQFDNRYFAKLPDAAGLGRLGVLRVVLVVGGPDRLPESPDLNEYFVGYAKAGITIKVLYASRVEPVLENYEPVARATDFVVGNVKAGVQFGKVPVLVDPATRAIVGAKLAFATYAAASGSDGRSTSPSPGYRSGSSYYHPTYRSGSSYRSGSGFWGGG